MIGHETANASVRTRDHRFGLHCPVDRFHANSAGTHICPCTHARHRLNIYGPI